MRLKEWLATNKCFFGGRDLRFLLKYALSQGHPKHTQDEFYAGEETIHFLDRAKKLYTQGMPMAYILGKEEFYGLTFTVNRQTLIPRQETELLVEEALKIIQKERIGVILDLGCGSANISCAIAKEIKATGLTVRAPRSSVFYREPKNITIVASDISIEALEVSKRNIRTQHINVPLVNADLFSCFKEETFDLIVSNPPYVEDDCLHNDTYLAFEPNCALSGGEDGLFLIRKIIFEGHRYLKKGGYLLFEFGFGQRQKIEMLLKARKAYHSIRWFKDYSGTYRALLLKK